MKTSGSSYRGVLRLIFVIFSLYLVGDAFYRWDGFRYYSSFSEFVPSVGLAAILWSILALLTSLVVWCPLRAMEWLSQRVGLKIKLEQLLIFLTLILFFSITVKLCRSLKIPYVTKYLQLNLASLLIIVIISLFLTWFIRNKAESWLHAIQERITPLVWLFGIFAIISIPIVVYTNWFIRSDSTRTQKVSEGTALNNSRPNIILVTFDALAAQNMSLYGYDLTTTPFMSDWAKSVSLFKRLYASDNHTTPTVASLLTGKRVWTHQSYHQGSRPVKGSIENLPIQLKNNGYTTMSFVLNAKYASPKVLGMSQSFDISPPVKEFVASASVLEKVKVLFFQVFGEKIKLYNWLLKNDFILSKLLNKMMKNFSTPRVPPEKAFNKFLEVIDSAPSEPFFAWIHIFPPHDPYLPPEPFRGHFETSTELRTYAEQHKFINESFKYLFENKPYPQEMQPEIDLLRAYYDEFIRYCDKQFEDFIVRLDEKNKLDTTLFIVSADGESFEHGYFTHQGPYLYEQVTHIPLLIKAPNQNKGMVIHDIVEQIDISPTILDLVDIPVPEWMEGRSMKPLLQNNKLPAKPAFSMNLQNNPSQGLEITAGTFAVWKGNYKLIHYLDNGNNQLFNLRDDPDELNNIFNRNAETGKRLLNLIQSNLEEANERISAWE